jgi:hypothetical protein
VLKAIKGKVLPATRVGGTWVLQRSVVERACARRGERSRHIPAADDAGTREGDVIPGRRST